MTLSEKTSNRNLKAFLWHAAFLAFAQNFTDVDTIIPAMLIEAGGGAVHIGIMSAIMTGGANLSQLFFAPFISNSPRKKGFLLAGINTRIFSLLALGMMFLFTGLLPPGSLLLSIFLLIALFSFGGAFANISYFDILGKAVSPERRMTFFSIKQALSGAILLLSSLAAGRILSLMDFPVNYALMFIIGGAALLVASGGFWFLEEEADSVFKIDGLGEFFRVLTAELQENRQLLYFLGLINVQGIALSFLPFVMLYAKKSFASGSGATGSFLFYKVAGVVVVGLLILLASGKTRYKPMLYANVAFSVLLALIAAISSNLLTLGVIFFIGGVVFALYYITMNGVLLEISTHHNRAIYTGFLGAGNILPLLFPFAGGWFINSFGFRPFFLLFALIVSAAVYFIGQIDCRK